MELTNASKCDERLYAWSLGRVHDCITNTDEHPEELSWPSMIHKIKLIDGKKADT